MTQTVSITMYDLSLDKAREALDALEKIGVSTEYPKRNESLKGHPQHIEGEGKKPGIEMPPAADENGHLSVADPAGDGAPPEETPETTPAPADAKRDARGLLHDLRIHTPVESFLATGNWKNRRHTAKTPNTPEQIAAVEAELFAEAAEFKLTQASAPETGAGSEIELPPEPGAEESSEMQLPPELGAGETTPETKTEAPAAEPQFPKFMQYFIEQKNLGKITAVEANQIAVEVGESMDRPGVTAMAFLASNDDLVPMALAMMQAKCS